MILDAADVGTGSTLSFDLCICGGGVAGLSLALELRGAGMRVVLLEGGGLARENASQDLYAGRNASALYADGGGSFEDYLRSSRSRFLGGSSNCWGGWCRPYDEIDFERRPWVPHSGWPFGREALAPHYARAQQILRIGPPDYDPQRWSAALGEDVLRLLAFDPQALVTRVTQFSAPLRMGQAYRDELAQAPDLLVILHANVVEIESSADGSSVEGVQVQAPAGPRFRVRSRAVVLAAGGIENARLLLASNRRQPAGLGNAHDMVGRYFMEHASIPAGRVAFAAPRAGLDAYDGVHFYRNPRFAHDGTTIAAHWALSTQAQRTHGVLNSRSYLRTVYAGEDTPAVQALINAYRWASRLFKHRRPRAADFARLALRPDLVLQTAWARLGKPARLVAGTRLEHIVEACPDPDSRVRLDTERDALGMPRVLLDWRPGGLQKRTIAVAQEVLDGELRRLGLGHVVREELPAQGWPDAMQWVWHHMGTTRMHPDPRHGVVDADGRVHGLANLYVAGSSVFPTSGTDAPTLTIVALAVRLAAHLRGALAPASAVAPVQ